MLVKILLSPTITTIFIVINYITLIDSWNLNSIQDIITSLDCLHISIGQVMPDNVTSIYTILYESFMIPLENRNLDKLLSSDKSTSTCRHKMLQLKDEQELKLAMQKEAKRSGYLFLLFAFEPNWPLILEGAEYYWSTHRIHKVIYISQEITTRFYHPFIRDDHGEFGGLVAVEEYNLNNIFHNLNGYPMRVYIFDSVFSSLMADADAMQITGVKGTDGKVATLLEEYLNYTMELQWPDDDFFG